MNLAAVTVMKQEETHYSTHGRGKRKTQVMNFDSWQIRWLPNTDEVGFIYVSSTNGSDIELLPSNWTIV